MIEFFVFLGFVVALFSLYAVWQLNKYIQKLEDMIDMQIDRIDALEDSFRTVVKENYLKPNVTVKKPLIPNEE